MSNDDRDIRSALEREADKAPLPQGLRRTTVRRGMGRRIGFIALPLVLVASLAWVAIASPLANDGPPHIVGAGPDRSGQIVFSRFSNDGNAQIMVMNGDGSEVRPVVDGHEPAWSPDGSRIAFVSYRDNNPEIYVMDADGSHQTRLTHSTQPEALPTWSPDGTRIAFVSYREGQGDIFVMHSDGSHEVRITSSDLLENRPAWSPDGSELAFHRFGPDGDVDIYTMSSDGNGITRLTTSPEQELLPAWSPDGSTIAVLRYSDGRSPAGIHLMNADGSSVTELVTDVSNEYGPAWSPDGTRIVFVRPQGTNVSHIYSINVDGTDERQLTFGDVADHSPDWGPPASDEREEGETLGRYTFRSGGGFDDEGEPAERVGTVEINSAEGSICVESQILGASSAHVHREDDPSAKITIFQPPERYRPTICTRGLDPDSLQAVIDDPTSYYIEFHNKSSDGTLTAPLEIMGEPEETRLDVGTYCVGEICLSSASGGPGSIVNATVPISRTMQDGTAVVDTKKVLWWWDLPPDEWVDTVMKNPPRSAFLLASTRETVGSRYRFSLTIPAPTRPGEHDLVAVIYWEDGAPSSVPFRFEVDRCPQLLRPGKRPESAMKSTVREYLRSRRPEGARGFSYEVERTTEPIRGGYGDACSAETWNRSFIVEGSFRYPDSAKNPSASLAYFRFVVGAARHGWIVWDVLH